MGSDKDTEKNENTEGLEKSDSADFEFENLDSPDGKEITLEDGWIVAGGTSGGGGSTAGSSTAATAATKASAN